MLQKSQRWLQICANQIKTIWSVLFPQIPRVAALHVKSRYLGLILSAWAVTGVQTALGGLYSPCVPMWRDREEDRPVDVTLGYDLNTCLRRLSSDQSSLCQAPLPAGNFSTHVTPSLTFSFCFSSLLLSADFFILLIFSLSPGLSPASHPSIHSWAPVQWFTHLLYLSHVSLSLPNPSCFFSHRLRPSCSFYPPCCRGHCETISGASNGQMEMNARHKAENCRHTHNTLPAAKHTSIQIFYTRF